MQEIQRTQVPSLGWEDPPRIGNGNMLQYSCLKNFMDRGTWQAIVHGITKNQDATEHIFSSYISFIGILEFSLSRSCPYFLDLYPNISLFSVLM